MDAPKLQINLIAATDDPPLRDVAYQQELRAFEKNLQSQGLKVGITIECLEAASGDIPGMATYLGGFIIQFVHSPLAGPLGAAVGAWLHARYGRKVRLKVGDIEAEAQTVEEVEKLIARAQEIQRNNQPKVIRP